MKTIYKLYLSIVVLCAFFTSCQNDDLPKANFDLNAITVFSGDELHEKVNVIWQAPNGDTDLQGYVLSWSPNDGKVDLDAATTSYEVTGLTTGTKYKFTIQANYGDLGISGGNSISLTPQDELNFTVLPGNEFAIAKWNTPNRTDILGYTLSWEPNGEEVAIASDKNSYQVAGLSNEVEYTFTFNIDYADGTTSNNSQATAIPGEISAFLMSEASPMSTESVLFTYNPAYLLGNEAASWSWDFGDGTTSTAENPTHTFANTGTYNVSIQITDTEGTVYSDTQEVNVWGIKWSFQAGADIRSSSPAIADDGTIYVGARDNNLYAFNPDGTVKWTFATENGIDASPSIASDGTIYCGSYDDKMYAINPDGSQKWNFTTGGNIRYTAPAIASDGTVYFGSEDSKLYALNPDGTVKWEFLAGGQIRSTPAIGSDGTVYTTSNTDNLVNAINPSTGALKWSYTMPGFSEGGPSIDEEGTIFVGTDNGSGQGSILAINPDGTEKWTTNVIGRISVNVPVIANGRIYIGTKEGNNLLAIDKSSGSQVWSFDIPGQIVISNPAVDVNGDIYFGGWNNGFYAIKPDGTLKYHLETARVWCSPAIGSDGTVYFGAYDGTFYAVEMFAEGLATDAWPMFGKNISHTGN